MKEGIITFIGVLVIICTLILANEVSLTVGRVFAISGAVLIIIFYEMIRRKKK